MQWEHRLSLRNMLKKLQQLNAERAPHDHGEVDFMLLSSLSSNKEGWLGMVLQSLHRSLSQDASTEAASALLEETAAILVAWSAHLRAERLRKQAMPQTGDKVYVRIPSSQLSWLGVVLADGRIQIDALRPLENEFSNGIIAKYH